MDPNRNLLDPERCVVLLVDHQPQMAFGVHSHDMQGVVNNTVALAKTAKAFGVPTILTTVGAMTFSGPLFEGVQAVFPHVKPIDRSTMNTWEDERVVDAVEATGRKTLVLAGLWTEVCVAMPALDALKAGYEVFVVADACAGTSPENHERAMQRMTAAGAVPVTWVVVTAEWQRDWARGETADAVRDIFREHGGTFGIGIAYAKAMYGAREGAGAKAAREAHPKP